MRVKTSTKRQTMSLRSGLQLPVARVHKKLRQSYSRKLRVTKTAAVYTTAVLEYLCAEVLEISGNAARDAKRRKVMPRHIMLAVKMDEEVNKLLEEVTFPQAGVLPNVQSAILPKNKRPMSSSITISKGYVTITTKAANANNKAKAVAAAGKPKPTAKAAAAAGRKVAAKKQIAKKKAQPGASSVTILNERVLVHGHKLCVLSGDIVHVQADAIVVPSSSTKSMSGQVGTRVSEVGGTQLQANINSIRGGIASTQAACVASVNTAADNLMLCNGPGWGNNPGDSIPLLVKTVNNCLKLADKNKYQTVCFPSIGSGVGGFPKQTAAQTILKTISDYFKANHASSNLSQVNFVLFDNESIQIYVSELGRLVE